MCMLLPSRYELLTTERREREEEEGGVRRLQGGSEERRCGVRRRKGWVALGSAAAGWGRRGEDRVCGRAIRQRGSGSERTRVSEWRVKRRGGKSHTSRKGAVFFPSPLSPSVSSSGTQASRPPSSPPPPATREDLRMLPDGRSTLARIDAYLPLTPLVPPALGWLAGWLAYSPPPRGRKRDIMREGKGRESV
ncbi:hypothetical protein GGS23DRAFT_560325 [Durotheca rogersii]|uniref:uncharacterized protein n=1 Tax=Durotheca rogersii TaxID=419775 RepID=UPI002220C349|nr:uncharacterized protein GGS23DRAFT_560325 [Durotheca rogersii]KAI5864475.1 hypothetical protein GGS23DRAFT_560325 [Durotheca rogersii]